MIPPKVWRDRAQEARDLAEIMKDPVSAEMMRSIADDYEELAAHLETRDAKVIELREYFTNAMAIPPLGNVG